ncbi:MAG TPA: hypothetical protein PKG95_14225, partial [Anaerolineaceae bacterium]|nr:hypothetical protein [Anaerolineaceae bacterium]
PFADGGERTPTPTPTPEPPLGPLGRLVISGVRVLMVPQNFQYQEIPAGASQEELFASSAATNRSEGVIVLDVPTTPVSLAPGVVVNPATLIAALDRFGGLHLALEPGAGLETGEVLTLNLASLYQVLNQGAGQVPTPGAAGAAPTRPAPGAAPSATPTAEVPTALPTLAPRP